MPEEKPSRFCSIKTCIYVLAALSFLVFLNMLSANNHLSSLINLSKQLRKGFERFTQNQSKILTDLDNRSHESSSKSSLNIRNLTSTKQPNVHLTPPKVSTTASKPPTIRLTTTHFVKPTSRPDDCKSCFNHDFKYILDNEHICDTGNGKSDVDIILMIFTVHANKVNRQTIRETWLTSSKNNTSNFRYAFLLGYTPNSDLQKQVEAENSIHHDIIQEDFIDKYLNLTYKTMMAFKWATTKCSKAKFVMKTDDDMYVNLESLKHVVDVHGAKLQSSVGGACHQSAGPIRDKNSKWYASVLSYPRNSYPGFCSGTGYVTSMNVATKVFEISKHVPFFHLEDVYVAICIRKLGLKLTGIGGFNSGRVGISCVYKTKNLVTSHYLNPQLIRQIWNMKC